MSASFSLFCVVSLWCRKPGRPPKEKLAGVRMSEIPDELMQVVERLMRLVYRKHEVVASSARASRPPILSSRRIGTT